MLGHLVHPMSRCAVLCYAILCHAMLWCVMLSYAILCYDMSCYGVLSKSTSALCYANSTALLNIAYVA